MKIYKVKNLNKGKIEKINAVDILSLRKILEIKVWRECSEYRRVNDKNEYIELCDLDGEHLITFDVLSCETV